MYFGCVCCLCCCAVFAGEIGDNSTAIALHYYKTLNITKKPYATSLYALSNQPVQIKSKYIDGTTGETLDESKDIENYVDVQGTRVPFTKEQLAGIVKTKAFGTEAAAPDLGFIKLLYFTSNTSLHPEINFSTPYYIFPDDKSIKGSGLLYTAVLDEMHAKQLIAIGVFVRNKSSAPRFVAVYPQRENAEMSLQEGLFVIPLPYAGEVRSVANTTAGAQRTVKIGK